MGLHSPFGYVGYTVPMGKTIIDLLERFCGGCHTDDDYTNGCKGCPAGQLIYEARDYILSDTEEDKHYSKYASNEWQEGRKKNGMPEEPTEEREKWARLAKMHKQESIALRGLKKEIKHIEPHPFFYSTLVIDSKRYPDQLYKFKEYLKDYEFHNTQMFNDWRISGAISDSVRARLKDELAPILIMNERERDEFNSNRLSIAKPQEDSKLLEQTKEV